MAVAEGAYSAESARAEAELVAELDEAKGSERRRLKHNMKALLADRSQRTEHLAAALEKLTGLESRVTILGHVQRGGTPSSADRLLATRLGTACAEYIAEGLHGVMVASRGDDAEPVPIKEIAGITKYVPVDHPWVRSARHLGISIGD